MIAQGYLVLRQGGIDESEKVYFQALKRVFRVKRDAVVTMLDSIRNSEDPDCEVSSHSMENTDPVSSTTPDPETVLSKAVAELEGLVGVPKVKSEIVSLTNFLQLRKQRLLAGLPVPSQSLHFVFSGNPGTGKTTVARIVSRILYGFGLLETPKLIETERSGLVGGYVGQTAIKTTEVIQNAVDGVLFIDEAYSLSPNEAGTDYGPEAIDTILKMMEDYRERLVVIVAGYPQQMREFLASNPGLESRFTRFVEFDDYSVRDLCQIFEGMCQANTYTLTQAAKANLALFCNRAFAKRSRNFGNGRFVRNAYERTLGNHADRLAAEAEDVDRQMLVTIDACDLPFDMVVGMTGPIDVTDSKWRMRCMNCSKQMQAGINMLGRQVRCKCGQTCTFLGCDLRADSLPEFSWFESQSGRRGKLSARDADNIV